MTLLITAIVLIFCNLIFMIFIPSCTKNISKLIRNRKKLQLTSSLLITLIIRNVDAMSDHLIAWKSSQNILNMLTDFDCMKILLNPILELTESPTRVTQQYNIISKYNKTKSLSVTLSVYKIKPKREILLIPNLVWKYLYRVKTPQSFFFFLINQDFLK